MRACTAPKLRSSAVIGLLAVMPWAAGLAPPARSAAATFEPMSVYTEAKRLSSLPYERPQFINVSAPNYDRYRLIQLRSESSVWRDTPSFVALRPLLTGWLYNQVVRLNIVEDGKVKPVVLSGDMFEGDAQALAAADFAAKPPEVSGFRINGELNTAGKSDEIVVFQGASYFRGLSKGQSYGLSARGLAIGTGGAKPEEFPVFKEFWVERPNWGQRYVTVHALLDSPSASGAYEFRITPGEPTTMDVQAHIFPRVTIADVGIAPLTSMYLKSPLSGHRIADFRSRIHDSDGLAIINGGGEHLWRPRVPLQPGTAYSFAYGLSWPDLAPIPSGVAWVKRTLFGAASGEAGRKGKLRFVVDYAGVLRADGGKLPTADVYSSAGSITDIVVQAGKSLGEVRISFLFEPGQAELAEMRLELVSPTRLPGEVWLYRWTGDRD